MVARPPVRVVVEPMRLDDLPERPRDRAGELHLAVAAQRLPERARDEPARALPRRPGRRRRRRRTAGCGSWSTRPTSRPSRSIRRWRRAAHRRAAAARVPRPGPRSRRPRGDARGPAVEPARPPAVREVRVPPGRPAAALLQRRQRGRADHDHGATRVVADARAHRTGCAPRWRQRRPRCARPRGPTTAPRRRRPDRRHGADPPPGREPGA